MKHKTNNNLIQLKNWLLNKPALFALSFFILTTILSLGYALIQTVFNIENSYPLLALFVLSFILCTWYTIRKLPHDKMNQNDFVAITNGATLISLMTSLVIMIFAGWYGASLKANLMMFYLGNKTLFFILFMLIVLFSLYMIGLTICEIYAKYKRATSIGIKPWKVILSMPFAFLLMWTPGYLLKGANIKNNLEIKSSWYGRFQKWVMLNSNNILFTFIFLMLCRGIITGLTTFILYASLLIIYALWYTKHKSDFMKKIDNGYAMTAVGINITILIAVIYFAITSGGH